MRFDSGIELAEGWEFWPLESACSRVTSGGTPSRKRPEFFGGTIPWVKTQELRDCVINSAEEFITDEALAKSSAKLLPANTVLLAMYGATVGQLGVLGQEATCNQACCAFIVNQEKADYRFLYYTLLGHRENIVSLATGAAQQNLSGKTLKSVELPFPPLAEQKGIADLLWSIDQKIANNRALAADLEAMARAIFKSWFVDFDPVKAKMKGRAPAGMDAETAALFPDEMVESELGLIPKGWEVLPLQSKARLDTTPVKPFEAPVTVWRHYSIPAFDDRGYPTNDRGAEIKSGKHLVNPGAILISKLNPSQWRCWRPDPTVLGEHAICSPEFMQIVGTGVTKNWIWGLCHSQPFKDLVNSTTDGTTGSRQRAKPKLVMQQPVIFPARGVVEAYEKFVRPMLALSDVLILEIQELTELRDALLPRLISGKLRAPQATEAVEVV